MMMRRIQSKLWMAEWRKKTCERLKVMDEYDFNLPSTILPIWVLKRANCELKQKQKGFVYDWGVVHKSIEAEIEKRDEWIGHWVKEEKKTTEKNPECILYADLIDASPYTHKYNNNAIGQISLSHSHTHRNVDYFMNVWCYVLKTKTCSISCRSSSSACCWSRIWRDTQLLHASHTKGWRTY